MTAQQTAAELTAKWEHAEVALFDSNHNKVSPWHRPGDNVRVNAESSGVTLCYAGYRLGDGDAELYLEITPLVARRGHTVSGVPMPLFSDA